MLFIFSALTAWERRATLSRESHDASRPYPICFATDVGPALLDACLLISIHAQVPADPLGINSRRLTADMVRDYNTAPNTAVVIFKVFGERKGHLLDRQAVLKLTNPATQFSTWQTTSRDPAGENLETGSEAVFLDVALGV